MQAAYIRCRYMYAYTPVMLSFAKEKLNDLHMEYCRSGVLKQFHEKCQNMWHKLRIRTHFVSFSPQLLVVGPIYFIFISFLPLVNT